jgi:hypothetical protein
MRHEAISIAMHKRQDKAPPVPPTDEVEQTLKTSLNLSELEALARNLLVADPFDPRIRVVHDKMLRIRIMRHCIRSELADPAATPVILRHRAPRRLWRI